MWGTQSAPARLEPPGAWQPGNEVPDASAEYRRTMPADVRSRRMSWAKIDDQFHGHRKATKAWRAHPRALGLHLLAMSYCAGHLTDGLVDDEFVEEKIPAKREREQTTAALVDAELWEREDGGWRIHDWLEFNPSRADTLEKRRKEAERKARGRAAQAKQCPPNVHPDTGEVSGRTNPGVRADDFDPSDGPDPTRPDPVVPRAVLTAAVDVVERASAHPGNSAALDANGRAA